MIYKFPEQSRNGKIPCIITGRLAQIKSVPVVYMETVNSNDKQRNFLCFYLNYDYEMLKNDNDPNKVYCKQIGIKCTLLLTGFFKNTYNIIKKLKEYSQIIVFGWFCETVKEDSEGNPLKMYMCMADAIIPLDGIFEKIVGEISQNSFKKDVKAKALEQTLTHEEDSDKYPF